MVERPAADDDVDAVVDLGGAGLVQDVLDRDVQARLAVDVAARVEDDVQERVARAVGRRGDDRGAGLDGQRAGQPGVARGRPGQGGRVDGAADGQPDRGVGQQRREGADARGRRRAEGVGAIGRDVGADDGELDRAVGPARLDVDLGHQGAELQPGGGGPLGQGLPEGRPPGRQRPRRPGPGPRGR